MTMNTKMRATWMRTALVLLVLLCGSTTLQAGYTYVFQGTDGSVVEFGRPALLGNFTSGIIYSADLEYCRFRGLDCGGLVSFGPEAADAGRLPDQALTRTGSAWTLPGSAVDDGNGGPCGGGRSLAAPARDHLALKPPVPEGLDHLTLELGVRFCRSGCSVEVWINDSRNGTNAKLRVPGCIPRLRSRMSVRRRKSARHERQAVPRPGFFMRPALRAKAIR